MKPRSSQTLLLEVAATLITLLCYTSTGADAFISPTQFLINSFKNSSPTWVRNIIDVATNYQPKVYAGVEAIVKRRAIRGDQIGAQRLNNFKNWFSYTGLRRGIPVLAMDLYSKRRHFAQVKEKVAKAASKLQSLAATDGWEEAWRKGGKLAYETTSQVLKLLTKSIQTGPTAQFLSEFAEEIQDAYVVEDIVSVFAPQHRDSWVVSQVSTYIDYLRQLLRQLLGPASRQSGRSYDEL